MPDLAPSLPMFKAAKEKRFAIPALNANGNIITDALVEAAYRKDSPVLLQASQGAIKHAGQGDPFRGTKMIVDMTTDAMINRPGIPVALNLDHGQDPVQNALCFRLGFTMLMFDGSKMPLEENISNAKMIVEMAKAVPGIAVEVEIGRIGALADSDEPGVAIEEMKQYWTKPEEIAQLAKESGAHLFAVAMGQIHGCREPIAEIDFDLFEECIQAVEAVRDPSEIGFVLHGASGVKDEDVERAIIEFGVVKINVDTKLRQAYMAAYLKYQQEHPQNIDQRKPECAGHDAVVEVACGLMNLFGSTNKAQDCIA